MQIFRKILFLLSPDERKSAGLLLIMIVLMALLDVIGVASILPFMAVLTNPDIIETNIILNSMFNSQVDSAWKITNNFFYSRSSGIYYLLSH